MLVGLTLIGVVYATVLLLLCITEGASVFSPPKQVVRGLLRAWVPPVACYLVLVELFVPGLPREELTSRVTVEPGLPAELAGVRDGDVVVEANGTLVDSFEALARTSGPTHLVLQRAGERVEVDVVRNERGWLGLRASGETREQPVSTLLRRAFVAPVSSFVQTVRFFVDSPMVPAGGPIAIVRTNGSVGWLTAIAFSGSVVWPLTLIASLVITVVSLRRRHEAPRR